MNTNTSALTVLCYGDSNTYGMMPEKLDRYNANERWTGVLQQSLGNDYYVIEEGLSGRSTDLEHIDNKLKATRNGLTYFKACVESHLPLDVIIIMLGTNDLKTAYARNAHDIANALKQYSESVVSICTEWHLQLPRILFVSPVPASEDALKPSSDGSENLYDKDSIVKSIALAQEIKKIAEEYNYDFLDAAEVARVGADGLHMTGGSHIKLGHKIADIIIAKRLIPRSQDV